MSHIVRWRQWAALKKQTSVSTNEEYMVEKRTEDPTITWARLKTVEQTHYGVKTSLRWCRYMVLLNRLCLWGTYLYTQYCTIPKVYSLFESNIVKTFRFIFTPHSQNTFQRQRNSLEQQFRSLEKSAGFFCPNVSNL